VPVEVEIENINPEQTVIAGLAELSRKTGLMVRAVGPATVDSLFAEIEEYEEQERAETFSYLKQALNQTRASLGAEPAYKDE
jgi:hypothetical protein